MGNRYVEDLLKYLSVYLASAVKFLGGPLAGISFGLSYLETVLLTIGGMMTSVIVFTYLGQAANKWYLNYRRARKKPIFTRRNRVVVKVWGTFGIIGVAFLTPLILTPIFGTVVAAMLGGTKKNIILHMFWSAILWGFIITYLAYKFRDLALAWYRL